MSYFAEVINGKVIRVLAVTQNYINTGKLGDKKNWIQTSFNTRAGKHKTGGKPLRKNFAGIDYSYDKKLNAFIPVKRFNSWTLNKETCLWEAPIKQPTSKNGIYLWNEEKIQWDFRKND